MAAGPWILYNTAKRHIGDGTIDLDSDTFQMSLFGAASNAADATMELIGQLTNEVAAGFGYTTGGKLMTAVTWTVGASASEMRFSAAPVMWPATGGTISGIRFAVIWANDVVSTERKLLCYCQLETSDIAITSGNSLTVSPSATGIISLN